MKKFTYILIGIVMGLIMALPLHYLYAENGREKIEAWKTPYVQFEFDEQVVVLPSGYTVLNYQDRTYVPTRFVAEALGATVDWDQASQSVMIKSKKQEECIEPGPDKIPDEKPTESKIEYRTLPTTKVLRNIDSTITLVAKDDDYTRIYLRVENKQARPVRLLHTGAEVLIDKNVFTMQQVPSHLWDVRWFNSINDGAILEGYITIPAIPKDSSEMTVAFDLLYNDGSNEKHEMIYHIKF